MKNWIVFIVFFFNILSESCAQKSAVSTNSIDKAIQVLARETPFKNAGIGFYVQDLNSGDVLCSYNPNLALTPASTMKLLTTSASLEVLGADFRFKTSLAYDGKIDTARRILYGNLIILGGGDPSLGSKYFPETRSAAFLVRWAEVLKTLGIDSVSGRLFADTRCFDDALVPPTRAWEDMANYFGGGASGISIYDNSYSLFFDTGKNKGDSNTLIKISPQVTGLNVDNRSKADSIDFDNSFLFGAPYSGEREIRGELPLNKTNYEVRGTIPNPAYVAAEDLIRELKIFGIAIDSIPVILKNEKSKLTYNSADIKILNTEQSPPVYQIIEKTNLYSINLFAEHLLNRIGLARGGEGNTKSAAEKLTAFWRSKGMDTDGLTVADGCGLSRYTTVTAKQMSFMLNYMKNSSKNFDSFYASLPIAGKKGTIKSLCKGTSADGNIHAKSGSIRGVRAYAGYVSSKSGREMAFSIIINNYNGTPGAALRKIEKLLVALADFEE